MFCSFGFVNFAVSHDLVPCLFWWEPEPRTGSAAWQRDVATFPDNYSDHCWISTIKSETVHWAVNESERGRKEIKKKIQKLFGLALKYLAMLIGLCVCVLFSSDWSCSLPVLIGLLSFVLFCLFLTELFTCTDCILRGCLFTSVLADGQHHQDWINRWHGHALVEIEHSGQNHHMQPIWL